MLIAIESDHDSHLALYCCVCHQPFQRLSEAYIAHIAPTNGPPPEARWGHKSCFDGKLEQVFGGGHVRLWRADWAMYHLFKRLQQAEVYGIAL